jgi:opacity protein-like surface antigen
MKLHTGIPGLIICYGLLPKIINRRKTKMKKLFLTVLIIVLAAGPFLAAKSESKKVTYFSSKSLYIYGMGSLYRFKPVEENYLELGYGSSNVFAPTVGVGFRLLNAGNRFFLNIEGDFTPGKFDFDYLLEQEVNTFTIMLNGELRLNRQSPVSIFGGLGVGFHHLSDLGYIDIWDDWVHTGDNNIVTLAMGIGVKVAISRNFTFRSEFRWYGEVYGTGEYTYDWWDDEWDEDSNLDYVASTFSVGFEFHF